MKPPLFDYVRATSAGEAARLLREDPTAAILAGGQSLIPAMNFRLAQPSRLIDISRIPDLGRISIDGHAVRVGAAVRHRALETHAEAGRLNPLIPAAMAHVAHVPIRNRGTTVGSLCHADAAAEMPLVLLLSDGWVTAEGPDATRRIEAEDFFRFHMTTTRAPDEVIAEAVFPALPEGAGVAFEEFARRKGDYAIAAIAAVLTLDGSGSVTTARLGACGVTSRPVRLPETEAALTGAPLTADAVEAAAREVAAAVTAPDDTVATQAYRRHLAAALARRALRNAAARARKG